MLEESEQEFDCNASQNSQFSFGTRTGLQDETGFDSIDNAAINNSVKLINDTAKPYRHQNSQRHKSNSKILKFYPMDQRLQQKGGKNENGHVKNRFSHGHGKDGKNDKLRVDF